MALSDELNDLLAAFPDADRATVAAALERNPGAVEKLTQRETVYRAFVDGDTAAIANVTRTPTPTPVAADINDLMGRIFESPKFNEAIETRAKTLATQAAQEKINSERENIIGMSFLLADEAYQIRANHKAEFGVELDRSKFDPYFLEHGKEHGKSLTATYNAWVAEDRINKRIEAARAEGMAHRATTDIAGVSQPGAGTPAGMFMKANPMNTGVAASRGDALDQAAAAFRQLSNQRVQ